MYKIPKPKEVVTTYVFKDMINEWDGNKFSKCGYIAITIPVQEKKHSGSKKYIEEVKR
jgi:hypothetical protein